MQNSPIVILHGWNLSASRFQPLVDNLKHRGYKVYCFDLPGFGKSKFPKKPYKLDDYMEFVVDFLKKHKLNHIILIGHSFGGRIGIKLSSNYPKFIEYLVLTGVPGINPVPKIKLVFFFILAKMGKAAFSIPLLSLFTFKARNLLYKMAKARDFYHTNEKMRDTFKNIISEDLTIPMENIKCPTLLLWGEDDRIVPLNIAQKMKTIIKKSQLISISAARHGFPWTHPEDFADTLENFIKGSK